MADWRDVMEARREANERVGTLEILAGQIEEGDRHPPPELVMALSAAAICFELRAHAMIVDYTAGGRRT